MKKIKKCDIQLAENVLNKFKKGKLVNYETKGIVTDVTEALHIAISMIKNKC